MFQLPEMLTLFGPDAHVAKILAFEAALARAEARAGVIPQQAADAIAAAAHVESYDVAALYREAQRAGNVAIPVVRALTARVGKAGAAYVHWGATSQDAIDTAIMLQMREGLDLLISTLARTASSCAVLAQQHRLTLMAGRTLLQQATPITFGLKAARWLALLVRQVRVLQHSRRTELTVQFGGAAGTLAALGDHGLVVGQLLADELMLPLPDVPWHAERDRVCRIVAALGVTAGGMAKIASDIILLAQTEVGEVAEASGSDRGVSSAMPQKHNPVGATSAAAAAQLCVGQVAVILGGMPHEHERAAGSWQLEWVAIPQAFGFAAGAAAHVLDALTGLDVRVEQMRRNLDRAGGALMAESLSMALAPTLGRPNAQRLVQQVVDDALGRGRSVREEAIDHAEINAVLSREAIELALDPSRYLGSADAFIDRAIRSFQALEPELVER